MFRVAVGVSDAPFIGPYSSRANGGTRSGHARFRIAVRF